MISGLNRTKIQICVVGPARCTRMTLTGAAAGIVLAAEEPRSSFLPTFTAPAPLPQSTRTPPEPTVTPPVGNLTSTMGPGAGALAGPLATPGALTLTLPPGKLATTSFCACREPVCLSNKLQRGHSCPAVHEQETS